MSDAVMDADRSFVAALARGDAAAAAGLLDEQFNWIDGFGRVRTKAESERITPLLGDETGLKPIVHRYGDVVSVVVEGDKKYLLRVWGRRAAGWRLLVYHEVSQDVPVFGHGPGKKEWDNPCFTLPYEPKNQDERDCLAAWQQLEIAVMRHLPEEWVKYVADEFSLYAATRQHTKAGRVAVIEEQRKTNANSAPSPLVWNEMLCFPDAIVMRCEHQPFHGKATRVSRVFTKRNGQWLMAVSFQTSRQDAPVKTI
ncbi:MAG TPA: hypothetical protein VFB31_12405 [Pseudolabrys sp.]|nr:hypothetical protein [Pseudolabrys sp.]